MMTPIPGFWMHEASGVLRLAIEAYLRGDEMTAEQVAAMRAYLRQWMVADWFGHRVDDLRRRLDGPTSREALHAWLGDALDLGIDPL